MMSGHNAWVRQKPCLLPVTSGLLPLIQHGQVPPGIPRRFCVRVHLVKLFSPRR